jgi:quercetin dioxygenase-like cupin family protein
MPDPRRLVIDPGQGVTFLGLGAPVHRLVHPLTTGSQQLGVSLCAMPPGSRVWRHRHSYEEAYYVVSGTGLMYLEGVGDVRLVPGRAVYIPSGRVHGQVNDGDTLLQIVCSLSPPPPDGVLPEIVEEQP